MVMNYKIFKKTICPYGLVQQLDNLDTTAVKLNWVTLYSVPCMSSDRCRMDWMPVNLGSILVDGILKQNLHNVHNAHWSFPT